MRFASALFVALLLLLTLSVGVVSLRQRQGAGAPGGPPSTDSYLLTPADDPALCRLKAKTVVTRRLIDGELTLLDAAAWFQYLDAAIPSAGGDFVPDEEGLSDGERYCRQAIRWARGQARTMSPGQAARVERRLQAELDAFLQRDGGAGLPAVE